MDKDFRKTLERLGLVKTRYEIIGEVIGNLIAVGLIGWGLVSLFTLSWGQALLISWLFNTLCNSIRYSGK